ncbi:MAG: BrnA antitoxin family protein [Cyanobacteria bacterium J06576_12]
MSRKRTKRQPGESNDQDRTDWDRVDGMKDEDIDTSDIATLDAEFFKRVEVIRPPEKKHVSIRLDADVLDWMKSQGKGYQSRINAVLRAYYEAHQDDRSPS